MSQSDESCGTIHEVKSKYSPFIDLEIGKEAVDIAIESVNSIGPATLSLGGVFKIPSSDDCK